MRLHVNSLAGVMVLAISTTVGAQAQPPAQTSTQQTTSTTTKQTPDQTKTTTTKTTSTTSAQPQTTEPAPAQTQTTTTQSTSTTATDPTSDQGAAATAAPDQATTTTATTTTTTTPALTAATAADVKKGVDVYDKDGALVGKIDSVTGKDAVVSTGKTRASIAISSFAKNDKGLVLGMTKAELEAAAKPPAKK